MSIVSLPQYIHSRRASEPAPARREQLEAVAEQFEAIFLQQILKQMRKASHALASEDSMRNRELGLMHDLHDEVLAQHLAQKRQTGIAEMLVQQLGGQLESDSDALALSGDWQQAQAEFDSMVASVVRHESAGNAAAISPKGARGLMQLMPATAQEVAADLGLEYSEERLTADPAYNQQLGSAYLGKLLARYDGHKALAVAAYNAGPGRVDQWLQQMGDPRLGEIDTASWIERIPYAETRGYTRSIMRDLKAEVAMVEPQPSQQQPAQRSWHGSAQPAAAIRFPLTANGPVQLDIATQFKSPAARVALQEQGRTTAHASAAFAQPLRVEPKEESL